MFGRSASRAWRRSRSTSRARILEEDGKAFAIRPGSTFEVMRKLRQATHLPLWAKLTPNTGETSEVARAAEEGGADALVVANTLLAMAIDVRTRRPKLGNLMGGLSGPSLKPIALRMAYQSAKGDENPGDRLRPAFRVPTTCSNS